MKLFELIIDEEEELHGIEAISLVKKPAIQENFVALKSESMKVTLADSEKRILMGAALIPDKPIYRRKGEEEFYIYFSKSTIRKAMELYFRNHNHSNATREHEVPIQGTYVVESWIVEDTEKDKSRLYGMNVPRGTWMVSMKIENDEIWEKGVKEGELKGFSIEGYFSDKFEVKQSKHDFIDVLPDESKSDYMSRCMEALNDEFPNPEQRLAVCESDWNRRQELESFADYPEAASNAAQRAIDWKEKNGSDCGTQVGWVRARQLADKKPISRDTIARMASFARHGQNKDVPYSEGCGGIMWDAWGGTAGIEWAQRKLDEIDALEEIETLCQEINSKKV